MKTTIPMNNFGPRARSSAERGKFDVAGRTQDFFNERLANPVTVNASGREAINRSLLGGGIAGLTAQGLNMMTGDPDGNDDMNVIMAMAAGSSIGAASGALGRMARNQMAKKESAKVLNASLDEMPQTAEAQAVVKSAAEPVVGVVNPNAVHPDETVKSTLNPLILDAVQGYRGTDSPFGIPEAIRIPAIGTTKGFPGTDSPLGIPGAVAVKPGAVQNTGTVVPTAVVSEIEQVLGSPLGRGPRRAYSSKPEAEEAARNRAAIEGKKKLSQGTSLKYNQKVKAKESSQQMEKLLP